MPDVLCYSSGDICVVAASRIEVILTGESDFCLECNFRYITRDSKTHPIILKTVVKGIGINVVESWYITSIVLSGRTDAQLFTIATMNGEIYKGAVLDPYVQLVRGTTGNNFLVMDDNDPIMLY